MEFSLLTLEREKRGKVFGREKLYVGNYLEVEFSIQLFSEISIFLMTAVKYLF